MKSLFRNRHSNRRGSYTAETGLFLAAAAAAGIGAAYIQPVATSNQIGFFQNEVFNGITVSPPDAPTSTSTTEIHSSSDANVGFSGAGAYSQRYESTSNTVSGGSFGVSELLPKHGPYRDTASVQSTMETWFDEESGLEVDEDTFYYNEETGELIVGVRQVARENSACVDTGSLCDTIGEERMIQLNEEDQTIVGALLIDEGVQFIDGQFLDSFAQQGENLQTSVDGYASESESGQCEGIGCNFMMDGIALAGDVDEVRNVFVDENGVLNVSAVIEARINGSPNANLFSAAAIGEAKNVLDLALVADSVYDSYDDVRARAVDAEDEMDSTLIRMEFGYLSGQYYVAARNTQVQLQGVNEDFDDLYAADGTTTGVNTYAARRFRDERGQTLVENLEQATLIETGVDLSDNAAEMADDFEAQAEEMDEANDRAERNLQIANGYVAVGNGAVLLAFDDGPQLLDEDLAEASVEQMELTEAGSEAAEDSAEVLNEAVDTYNLDEDGFSRNQISLDNVGEVVGELADNAEDIFWGSAVVFGFEFEGAMEIGMDMYTNFNDYAQTYGVDAAYDYYGDSFGLTEQEINFGLALGSMQMDLGIDGINGFEISSVAGLQYNLSDSVEYSSFFDGTLVGVDFSTPVVEDYDAPIVDTNIDTQLTVDPNISGDIPEVNNVAMRNDILNDNQAGVQ